MIRAHPDQWHVPHPIWPEGPALPAGTPEARFTHTHMDGSH
jgi:hypothetical protein